MDQRASGVVSLADLLMSADARLRGGDRIGASIWPTGFDPLDGHLGGGLRGGELTLIGGPQGLGKTTMALQMVRNAVAAGRSAIVFSYEHEARTLMERLIALEASTVAGRGAATIRQGSGVVTAFLSWQLERGLRSLRHLDRAAAGA